MKETTATSDNAGNEDLDSYLDKDLFLLCKDVNERFHKWTDTKFTYWGWLTFWPEPHPTTEVDEKFTEKEDYRCPQYDIEYLLEKIQSALPKGEYVGLSADNDKSGAWFACISNDYSMAYDTYADSPLKALLKLVIALDDAGVKL